jgi:hypothetical protein
VRSAWPERSLHLISADTFIPSAYAHPPPGEKICCLCGATRNVEVGHVNGREEDTAPENLLWTCRGCNVRSAVALKRAGIGRQCPISSGLLCSLPEIAWRAYMDGAR